MTEQILAALYYCIDEYGDTPSEALSHVENIEIFEGSMEEYAETLFQMPDDVGELEYIRRYLTIDYAQISYDCRCAGEWIEFNFNGSTWTVAVEAGDSSFISPEYAGSPNETLYAALIEQNIDALAEAISEGADLNTCPISTEWHPLDFALPCGMEYVNLLLEAGANPCLMESLDKDRAELDLNSDEDSEVWAYLVSLRDSQRLHENHGGRSRTMRTSL
jgi:hypothetical protein